jgi:hypothetical protein
MAQNVFRRPIWWSEPAHPGIVQQLADIVALYGEIRRTAQERIDKAFDHVSGQIGFVVALTLPVAVTVDDKRVVTAMKVRGDQYKGTLFEAALTEAVAPLIGRNVDKVSPGTYNVYAIWQAALGLALQRYWFEPAHPGIAVLGAEEPQMSARKAPPGVHEPAHFLDGAYELSPEDTIVIAAIDKVYPELRLAERIATARTATRPVTVSAYVKEPAHSRASILLENDSFMAALRDLVQKFSG